MVVRHCYLDMNLLSFCIVLLIVVYFYRLPMSRANRRWFWSISTFMTVSIVAFAGYRVDSLFCVACYQRESRIYYFGRLIETKITRLSTFPARTHRVPNQEAECRAGRHVRSLRSQQFGFTWGYEA